MISYIEGRVVEIDESEKKEYIVVLTTSGLGYKVYTPSGQSFCCEDEVQMFTSFQVREDSHNLYGFISKEQLNMFENILSVSGIGPKVSLAIVSQFSAKEFKEILASANYNSLSSVRGLGQKGAKKIVLELQGIYIQDDAVSEKEVGLLKELKGALKSLGFQGEELDRLMKKGEAEYKSCEGKITIDKLISIVLKND